MEKGEELFLSFVGSTGVRLYCNTLNFAFYDSNKTFISAGSITGTPGLTLLNSIKPVENAKYIRISAVVAHDETNNKPVFGSISEWGDLENISLNYEPFYKQNTSKVDYSKFKFAYIKNHKLICNKDTNGSATAMYTGIDLGDNNKAKKIMCKASFESGKEKESALICLIAQKNGLTKVSDITDGSVHMCFLQDYAHLDYYENGKRTNLATIYYKNRCIADDTTEYTMGIEFLGNNTIRVYKPDGTIEEFIDEHFDSLNGQYVTFEHYSTGDMDTYNIPQFTYFEVTKNDDTEPFFYDDFKREDGAIGISSSGHSYVQLSTNGYNVSI